MTDTRNIEQALQDLDRPQSHLLGVRDVSRRVRLYASPRWRRPLPTPVALQGARLIGAGRWLALGHERRRALAWAMRMLNAKRPSPAARRLARRAMMEHAAKVELAWRPWTVARMEIRGIEHLRAARRAGRGVVLISAHLGSWLALLRVLGLREGRVWVIRYRAIAGQEPLPGYIGLEKVVQTRAVERAGIRFVGRGDSYEVVRALLSRGEVCFLMFDFRGRTPTKLLGRRMSLASGAAALAWDLRAPVVPVFPVRRGCAQIGEMRPAIWPGDFADARALHDHLARLVSRTMRKHAGQAYPPETVLRPWAMTSEDRRRWRAERAARRAGRTA